MPAHAWLVGGGISALSAATLLVRGGRIDPARIHVLEGSDLFGGSLDGGGSSGSGWTTRGGRMFEPHFVCTFDLFDRVAAEGIPSIEPIGGGRSGSVGELIRRFNASLVPSSHCRLVRDRIGIEAPPLGLDLGGRLALARLFFARESTLGRRTIEEYFGPDFLRTDFWTMWCSMFAFQPWHGVVEMRRYMHRFCHLMPGFNRLEGVLRTPLNQYDSLIQPLLRDLDAAGVDLRTRTQVTDIDFDEGANRVTALDLIEEGDARRIDVTPEDRVFVTLGSMTEDSSFGSLESPAPLNDRSQGPAWSLWRRIAQRSPRFGRPEAFCSNIGKTRWLSFTATLDDSTFFDFMRGFSRNEHGTGGILTFPDSAWLISVFLPRQPHFAGQMPQERVFWGYGLRPSATGDRVRKPMADCSGGEMLRELAHHLGVVDHEEVFFGDARCIPCQMPYITSQFMPRLPGDRPAVVPEGAANFAFLGQFCEIPNDTVFTVEYSVRSAYLAVAALAGGDPPPPVHHGAWNPLVAIRALRALA